MSFKPDQNLYTISFSELTTYLSCHYKWKLSYVDYIESSQSVHLAYGSAIHSGLESFWTTNGSNLLAAQQLFEKTFKDSVSTAKYEITINTYNDFLSSGKELLSLFFYSNLYKTQKHRYTLIAVEKQIYSKIAEVNGLPLYFNGYIDLILYDHQFDKYIIIDFKTTTRGWSRDQRKDPLKTLQLTFYKKFLSEELNIDNKRITCLFILLETNRKVIEEVEIDITQTSLDTATSLLMKSVDMMYNQNMIQFKNNKSCNNFCSFNNSPFCDKNSVVSLKYRTQLFNVEHLLNSL